jgi:Tol biopolymer transport system component
MTKNNASPVPVMVVKPWVVPLTVLTLLLVSPIGANADVYGQRTQQPPNERIVFTQGSPDGGPAELVVAGANGGDARVLSVEDPPELFSFPVWSPDGSKILISHTFRLDASGECCLPFRPALVNADGSGFKLLKMAYAPQDMDCAAWTPDQARILCGFGGDRPGIFSVDATSGRDPIRLTTNPYGTSDQGAKELATAVSPDGVRFLFIRFKPGRTEQGLQSALFVENMDGSGLHQITPFGFIFPHDDQAWAAWSPDGRKIISTTSDGRLFTVHPDGKQLTVLHLQIDANKYFAFDPSWSPDGAHIVFAMYVMDAASVTEQLYTAAADGTNVRQITDGSAVKHSPDWGAVAPTP